MCDEKDYMARLNELGAFDHETEEGRKRIAAFVDNEFAILAQDVERDLEKERLRREEMLEESEKWAEQIGRVEDQEEWDEFWEGRLDKDVSELE